MTTVLDSPPVGRPGTPGRWDRSQLPYLLVLALGALGGFAFLGRSALYLDEAVSTSIARTPWHRFTDVVVHQESNQSLYYLVLRGWIHLGDSEFVLRTLSVVAVVAALAVLMYVTNELFGRKVALVCGVLLAVDPLIVEMAQDVRGYALSVLFVSASSALFVHAITRSSGPLSAGWTSWAGYVVFSALAAYTNFWAALIPVAHAVSLAFLPLGGIPWRRLVPSGVVLALLLVPLGLLIHANDSSGKYNWASGTSAGHLFAKVRAKVPHAAIDLVVLLVVAVIVYAVVLLRRRAPSTSFVRQWPLMFTVSWLVVPLAAVVLLSFVYKPLLVVRYLVVFLPPAAMLVALGLSKLSRRSFAVGLAVLVVASAAGLASWYKNGWGEDWRGALDALAARSAPGDGVVVFPAYMRIPFEWYLQFHPTAEGALQPVFPSLAFERNPLLYDGNVKVDQTAVTSAARRHDRVWLVLSQSELDPTRRQEVMNGLGAAGLGATRTYHFEGVRIVEYTTPGTAVR